MQKNKIFSYVFILSFCIPNAMHGQKIILQTPHTTPIIFLQATQNNKHVVSCSDDGKACAWDINSSKNPIREINFGSKISLARLVEYENSLFFIAAFKTNVFIWDVYNNHIQKFQLPAPISTLIGSSYQAKCAMIDTNGTAHCLNLKTNSWFSLQNIATPFTAMNYHSPLAFAPENYPVMAVAKKEHVELRNVDTRQVIRSLFLPNISFLHFTLHNEMLYLIACTRNGRVHVWNANTDAKYFKQLEDIDNIVRCSVYDGLFTCLCEVPSQGIPDGSSCYVAKVIDLESNIIKTISVVQEKINCLEPAILCTALCKNRIAVGRFDGKIALYNLTRENIDKENRSFILYSLNPPTYNVSLSPSCTLLLASYKEFLKSHYTISIHHTP